jgi:hypothetical protein
LKQFAITLALAVACPAAAQQTQVIGIGAMDCRQTVELIDGRDFKIQLASWINGYFSGINQGRLDADSVMRDLRSVNLDTSAADVYAYCARHPDEFIVNAAKDIYLKLPKI